VTRGSGLYKCGPLRNFKCDERNANPGGGVLTGDALCVFWFTQSLVDDLAAGGASSVTFHWEATGDAAALAQRIRNKQMRAACALKPATPADVLFPLLDAGALDMVLVLSVEPGFGGQSFKSEVLPKVRFRRCPHLEVA